MKKIILALAFLATTTAFAGEREGLVHSRHIKCQAGINEQVVTIENPLENVKIQNALDPMGQPLLKGVLLISETPCTPELLETIRVDSLDRFGFIDLKITDVEKEVISLHRFGKIVIKTLLEITVEFPTSEGPIEFKATKVLSTRTSFEP